MAKHLSKMFSVVTILALMLMALPMESAQADNTAQSLPFSQDWTDTGLITATDDWSGVPGIIGYLGDDPSTTTAGADPQTILVPFTTQDVIANQTNTGITNGGVAEFHITDPVVALQGSGTADAPHIVLHLNTTGQSNITISYNLRDIDGSADNAVQPVALQYRVGSSGNFTNLPAGFVSDATTGPSLNTLVTPVSVQLPVEAENQPEVQVRIITYNAGGSDEWVGIDDINVSTNVGDGAPSVSSTTPANGVTNVALDANIDITFSEPVDAAATWFDISCGISGAHAATVTGGPTTFTLDPDADFANSESCTVTVLAAQVTDQDSDDPPDNMSANYVFSFDTVSGATAAMLVINEIDYDQPSTDTAEFVEIRNNDSVSVDLSAYSVQMINGTGGGAAQYRLFALPAVTLAPGDYFVLCANASNTPNCDLDVMPDTDLVQNGAPDAVALLLGTSIVDTVSYEGNSGAPYTEGSGVGLEDDPAIENAGISRFPDGADTDQNNVDLSLRCSTPGEANVADSSNCVLPNTNLVINEIDYDQPDTDAAEFVEIRNNGDSATDLTGWTLELVNGTGGGAALYATIDLSGFTLAAGDYFIVCGDAANVPNCDLDATPDTNLVQNGAPDAVGLRFNGTLIDAVSYEGDTGAPYTEGSGTGLVDTASGTESISRCPDGTDTDVNNVDFVLTAITPGAANDCDGGGVTEAKIHEVQGSGSSVAITGSVTVEAIVVADYQADDQLSGFFLQEEDTDVDADPNTSEGIFVYCGSCTTDVAVGDKVEVTGQAEEFFGMSQIDITGGGTVTVINSGNTLPTPASIDLPASGSTRAELTFEKVEGMLVTFTDELVVSEYFELARFGQLVLTADARPSQFTDANEPSVSGYAAFLDDLNSKRIFLDDDNNIQNDALGGTDGDNPALDEPYFWPRPGLSNNDFFRGGDSITGLTGVLEWSFSAWRVRPVEPAFSYDFVNNNERPAMPEDVGGSLKVASFNVLNYFTTINSRGADSLAELDRQRAKTAAAICAIDADIGGLMEIENNSPEAISDLLNGSNGVNANCGPYAFIDTGVVGTDEIIQAFIYKPASVTRVGDYAVLDSSVDSRFNDDLNRPALAQTFQDNTTGGIFTVVVNHLKSKGSSCASFGDPDLLDGQGNCNLTRKNAAAAMVDWLATDPTGSGDEDFLIMGDLNSYRNEDPIDTIEAGADDTAGTADDYTDLLDTLIGPSAYSFVFDGQLGYLDTGLVSSGLLAEVTGATEWHINADEIPVFDYNDAIQDGSNEAFFERESTSLPIYQPNQFRSSDHDPVFLGLDLIPTCNGLPATIVGTPGVDVIHGTKDNDVIVGLGGNETINGGKGDDIICGNGGDDTLIGGDGDDILIGGYGSDSLDGGKGDDTLIGQAGNDMLTGGDGDDTLTGGTGADSFNGGPGDDTNTDFKPEEGDTSIG